MKGGRVWNEAVVIDGQLRAVGHPRGDKPALAEWMGYPTVAAMDADHDDLHEALCGFFDVPSHSLLQRDGKPHDAALAAYEEDAVLNVQRWLQRVRLKGGLK